MIRRSWLDSLLENFQHRWETNPQYRAAMSGVLGLIFLVFMCSCVGVVSIGAQSVLTSMGFGGGGTASALNTNTGTKNVSGASSIPISTVVLGTPQAPPVATLPNTGTPIPTPAPTATSTPTATPEPCKSNCGGGGGGGGGSIFGTPVPSVWKAGTHVTLHLHSTQPNVGFALIFNMPGVITQTFQPAGQTDGSGNADFGWDAPSYLQTGTGQITVLVSQGSGATVSVPCQN